MSRQICVQKQSSSVLIDIMGPNASSLGDLKRVIHITSGIAPEHQVLTCGSNMIHGHTDDTSLESLIPSSYDLATVRVTRRLCGGKPVKVKMMTSHLECGSEVTIDIDERATKDEIKMKLAEKTGVPFEHIKVMLSGINQIVMGDKRTNIGYSSCGYANSVQLAVEKAD